MALAPSINDHLNRMHREAEERDARRRADKAHLPYADLKTTPINIEALALIPEAESRDAQAATIELKEKTREVVLVVVRPDSPKIAAIIENLETQNWKAALCVVSLSSLEHVWNFYKFVPEKVEKITGGIDISNEKLLKLRAQITSLDEMKKALGEVNRTDIYTSEILEILLAGALALRASDIHLEASEKNVRLRLRIDGLLHDVFTDLKKKVYLFLLSRIKLLSELKLNVHDEPQDGRFAVHLPGKEIEIRVAIAPAEFGEVAVMRILDPDAINISLAELGLRDDDLRIIEEELKKPNGMILNTGPTGSGKTTTLYAFLKRKKTPEIKIITIEDPIEYRIEGIEQTQVDEEGGYTFASGLRSLMRQDPDVILVGEIRDKETSEIAIQAALTGHLVFSTVHANEAAGAIPRLVDLGVRPASIGPAVNLIIAQRLVRRLCETCKVETPTPQEVEEKIKKLITSLPSRVNRDRLQARKGYNAKGCSVCNGLGYKGRIAIYELLSIEAKAEELIRKEVAEAELQRFAREQGMVTMQQDGIIKVVEGITTIEEVESVTGPIDWGAL